MLNRIPKIVAGEVLVFTAPGNSASFSDRKQAKQWLRDGHRADDVQIYRNGKAVSEKKHLR